MPSDDMSDKKIEYFISFRNDKVDGKSYRGAYEVSRTKPISGIEDIESIANSIEKQYGWGRGQVMILNWQRFEDA